MLIGRWCLHHSLPERRAGWRIFCFVLFFQNINKRAVSSVSGSQELESIEPCITGSLPSSSLAKQWEVAQEHPSCPFVEPCKGSSTQVPAFKSSHARLSQASSQAPVLPPTQGGIDEYYTTHPDPTPCRYRPGHHKPRAGSLYSTSLPPLVSLGAWLALPCPSRWLLRTIRLYYTIQFTRLDPKFRGIWFTSVKAVDAPVLHVEIAVLLVKDAIKPVLPADMGSGFFNPYFIVPKKSCGLRRSWIYEF